LTVPIIRAKVINIAATISFALPRMQAKQIGDGERVDDDRVGAAGDKNLPSKY